MYASCQEETTQFLGKCVLVPQLRAQSIKAETRHNSKAEAKVERGPQNPRAPSQTFSALRLTRAKLAISGHLPKLAPHEVRPSHHHLR
jgi:hypothetical protein